MFFSDMILSYDDFDDGDFYRFRLWTDPVLFIQLLKTQHSVFVLEFYKDANYTELIDIPGPISFYVGDKRVDAHHPKYLPFSWSDHFSLRWNNVEIMRVAALRHQWIEFPNSLVMQQPGTGRGGSLDCKA